MRRSGTQQGLEGQYSGVMTDGLQSVIQSLSVINEVEVETWGWCAHEAHGAAL